jgi:hypothetical protein
VAVSLAQQAVNYLRRIPRNDPKRKRGLQIVGDWLRKNR